MTIINYKIHNNIRLERKCWRRRFLFLVISMVTKATNYKQKNKISLERERERECKNICV